MSTFSNLLSVYNGITSTSSLLPYSYTESLTIPTSLLIINEERSEIKLHFYGEEYRYTDKVLIFDTKHDENTTPASSYLFSDLKSSKLKVFYNGAPSGVSTEKLVDWSVNYGEDSLKDILKTNISDYKNTTFTPFAKKVYLNHNHVHDNKLNIYTIYQRAGSSENKYNSIVFGKQKPNPRYLSSILGISDDCNKKGIYTHTKATSTGFDGICKTIDLKGSSGLFSRSQNYSQYLTTSYSAYQEFLLNNGKRRYLYFTLGNFIKPNINQKLDVHKHLINNAWYVDYDDIFLLKKDNNRIKVELNTENEKVKKLLNNSSYQNKFLQVSSYLNFDFSYEKDGEVKLVRFPFEQILNNTAYINTDSFLFGLNYYYLSVSSRYPELVKLASAPANSSAYKYKVNIDDLLKMPNAYDDIVFNKDGYKDIFPSELIDPNKLAQHFHFTLAQKKKLINVDPQFLKTLNITGELDDLNGTANITYFFNNKKRSVSIEGLKTIPDFSGIKITGENIDDAFNKLKGKFPNQKSYFWNHITLQENVSDEFNPYESTVTIKPQGFVKNLSFETKYDWKFNDYEIKVPNTRDISLIPKSKVIRKNQKLSDLFEISPFAKKLNLTKSDYNYQIIKKTENSAEVLVTLNGSDDAFENEGYTPLLAKQSNKYFKVYVFEIDKNNPIPKNENNLIDNEEDNDEDYDIIETNEIKKRKRSFEENIFDNWLTSENIIISSSSLVFLGAVTLALLKKFGYLKAKII